MTEAAGAAADTDTVAWLPVHVAKLPGAMGSALAGAGLQGVQSTQEAAMVDWRGGAMCAACPELKGCGAGWAWSVGCTLPEYSSVLVACSIIT